MHTLLKSHLLHCRINVRFMLSLQHVHKVVIPITDMSRPTVHLLACFISQRT